MGGAVFVLFIFQDTGSEIGSRMRPSMLRTIKRVTGGILSPILAQMIRFAQAHPLIKGWALNVVCRYPAAESWLLGFAISRGVIASSTISPISIGHSGPTPRTLRIYADLKAAIEEHNRSS
jgi:hypothetical protein